MSYRYRLTIATTRPGVFRFPEASKEFKLGGHTVDLVARDGGTLEQASKVHFDGYEFAEEAAAWAAGERLRVRLQILDAALGLGLNVPHNDTVTAQTSDAVKRDIRGKFGATIVDSVFGLAVHPHDGLHFEYVVSADGTVHKPDGGYLLEGLASLWASEMVLDDAAEDALAIIGVATRESSDRARFLTTYLALEALIPRGARSAEARQLVLSFQAAIQASDLEEAERESLLGAIGALSSESFASALRRFISRIQEPPVVKGKPLATFLADCKDARNAIAHRSPLSLDLPLSELTSGLREFTLSMIWSMNRIPTFSLNVPGDQISFAPGAIQMRVL